MTTLHLIRHGRASAMEADYDQLHEMGQAQSRLLGEHLARAGQAFDAVYVGPLRRQLHTLQLMREAAAPHGVRWPEATVLEGLAEGPFEVLFKQYLRPRIKDDAVLQARLAELKDATTDQGRQEALEGMFDHMVGLWRRDALLAPDLERASVFNARVLDAKARIEADGAAGRQVAVVTSNGVIGELVEALVGLAPGGGRTRHRFYNTSVSLLELAPGGAVLHRHNGIEHIGAPELLTLL